jgi:large conductance mechanosensitive channel
MLSGFRKFLLQGNLISTAVAFIMATTFAAVVAAFVAIILDLIGKVGGSSKAFSKYTPDGVHVGAFITAVITFVIVAAVIYFLVVVPYTKAKERFFPDPEPGKTELDVLNEIRDLLAQQRSDS